MDALIAYFIKECKVLAGAPILSVLLLIIGFLLAKFFYRGIIKVAKDSLRFSQEEKNRQAEALLKKDETIKYLSEELNKENLGNLAQLVGTMEKVKKDDT